MGTILVYRRMSIVFGLSVKYEMAQQQSDITLLSFIFSLAIASLKTGIASAICHRFGRLFPGAARHKLLKAQQYVSILSIDPLIKSIKRLIAPI